MNIAHTADWHIAPEKTKRDTETGRNARLMDRARCAWFVIDDAVRRGADLIVHCGDLSNSWHWTPTIARLAKKAFRRAWGARIPVVILKGNHDDVRSPREEHALDLLRDEPGILVVDRPCVLDVWPGGEGLRVGVSPEKRPDPDGTALQLACLPYPNPALLLAKEEVRAASPGDRNRVIQEKMQILARGLAADRLEGVPRLLAGHFPVDIAEAGSQSRLMLLGGEFTLSARELLSCGFDGVLLGHIHKRQSFGENGWYCGSPEACSFSEEGEDKGYLFWTETGPTATELTTFEVENVPTPFRQLVTIAPETAEELVPVPREKVLGAIVRLRLPLAFSDQRFRLQRQIEEAGAFEVRVEIERPESARRVRETNVSSTQTLEAQLRAWAEHHPETEAHMEGLLAEANLIETIVGEEGGAA